MKQMNESQSDIDAIGSRKRLLPQVAFVLCILVSSGVLAETRTDDNNNSIVTAMYGFVNTKYADPESYTDDDYVSDLVKSIYGKPTGPDYSKESVYLDSLVESVNGTNHSSRPDFSNDEAYTNHLVEIILK